MLPSSTPTIPATGRFRWSSRPPGDLLVGDGRPASEALRLLLQWTEELDDDHRNRIRLAVDDLQRACETAQTVQPIQQAHQALLEVLRR